MKHIRLLGGVALLSVGVVVTALAAPPRRLPEQLPPPVERERFVPKFEAVAETSLLMEGLAQPNYRALEKHLQGKGPADADTWMFARGQAILIAETGNLLLLRPPRGQGRDAWMRQAMDMRQSAGDLARQMGSRDLQRSRTALAGLTTKCNGCHQTFRVPTRIGPHAEPPPPEIKGGTRDTE
jgi:hypothetical protein